MKTRENAKEFLRIALGNGPQGSREVNAAAKAAGFSDATLRRAKSELQIHSKKIGMTGGWDWVLPAEDDQRLSTFAKPGPCTPIDRRQTCSRER
jgi:putative DNA primase/helicase